MKCAGILSMLLLAGLPALFAQEPASTETATVQQQNDTFEAEIRKRIAGREQEPAEEVFKNVHWLKGVPAAQFLRIMNSGYSRALGVTCTHCHLESDFASDEKREKRAAREMVVMHRAINEKLKTMENIQSGVQARLINCRTCHRGHPNPRDAER